MDKRNKEIYETEHLTNVRTQNIIKQEQEKDHNYQEDYLKSIINGTNENP